MGEDCGDLEGKLGVVEGMNRKKMKLERIRTWNFFRRLGYSHKPKIDSDRYNEIDSTFQRLIRHKKILYRFNEICMDQKEYSVMISKIQLQTYEFNRVKNHLVKE